MKLCCPLEKKYLKFVFNLRMNSQVYHTIIKTIDSNSKLTRDEVYYILNESLKSNKDYIDQIRTNNTIENDGDDETAAINYQTFISIYSNLKRRQMFKTAMWRKLKENSLYFSNKYKEYQAKNLECKKYKSAADKLKDNLLLNLANEYELAPILMVRLILEGLIKTNSIELVDYDDTSDKKKEKITISQIIRETHLLKDGRLACEIIECCAIDVDYGPVIDSIKNLSGFKYEKKLENILNEKRIAFIKESELREKGSTNFNIKLYSSFF